MPDMKTEILPRRLQLPRRSFFLFGPRGVGKSTWLEQVLGDALRLDLLDASVFLELTRDPHRLEAMVAELSEGDWVVLDGIQKTPTLLDEVHRLMASRRLRFALCGSSARKLRRGGANLLAGRALTLSMESLSAIELGEEFDVDFALNWGLLPFVRNGADDAADILGAYVNTYLREEVQAEGLIRNVPPFVRFLAVAGQMNSQILNKQNIARDAAIPRSTVDTYFAILTDTLVSHLLPAWRPGLKVREVAQPKFYWFDSGVARAAAGLLRDPADRSWQGVALETLVYHELRVYNEISRKQRPIFYSRTPAGVEIDFVIETGKKSPQSPPHIVALEVKRAERWDRTWEKPMRALASTSRVKVERMIGVYCGERRYRFGNIQVWPVKDFIQALYAGEVF